MNTDNSPQENKMGINLTEAHSCEICKKPATEIPLIIDGQVWTEKTGRWVWAWVCPKCWEMYGRPRLGPGFGQQWENESGGNKLAG
jgi:hypothetical protein